MLQLLISCCLAVMGDPGNSCSRLLLLFFLSSFCLHISYPLKKNLRRREGRPCPCWTGERFPPGCHCTVEGHPFLLCECEEQHPFLEWRLAGVTLMGTSSSATHSFPWQNSGQIAECTCGQTLHLNVASASLLPSANGFGALGVCSENTQITEEVGEGLDLVVIDCFPFTCLSGWLRFVLSVLFCGLWKLFNVEF